MTKLVLGIKDLESNSSKLTKEWNYEKNYPLTPRDVSYGSAKKVWWTCSICSRDFEAIISNRFKGSGCPHCNKLMKTSEPEQFLFYYIKKICPDAINGYRPDWMDKMEIDIFIPSISCAIEYDGQAWHKSLDRDLKKTNLLQKHRISLIRVREKKCPSIYDNSIQVLLEKRDNAFQFIVKGTQAVIDILISNFSVNATNVDIDYERDRDEILLNYLSERKDSSIEKLYPSLLDEWDYESNRIKPSFFTSKSNYKAYWKCSTCGNKWQAPISRRTTGHGCPQCKYNVISEKSSQRSIILGKTDFASKCPELLLEWDYAKNKKSPHKYSYGSKAKVWWICKECGFSWNAAIYTRSKGSKCPKCAEKSRSQKLFNYNINKSTPLSAKRPELLEEWDYQKNQNLDPKIVTYGSKSKAHWICKACGNKWVATILSRSNGSGCPICAHSKSTNNARLTKLNQKGNTLEKNFPELLSEWNYEKNAILPSQISSSSQIKVWWKCHKCNSEWKTNVAVRTSGHGCPECSKIKIAQKRVTNLIQNGNSLALIYPQLAKEWCYEKNDFSPEDITKSSSKKAWWKCSNCSHIWCAKINNRSNGSGCPNCGYKPLL